jgi:hypothetical protein
MKTCPALATLCDIILQTLQYGIIERTRQLPLSGISIHINNQRHILVILLEHIKQAHKLIINNNAVHFSKIKDIGDVVWLQTVVSRDNGRAGGDDAVDRLEKSRRVWGEDTHATIAMLEEIVSKASGAISKLGV